MSELLKAMLAVKAELAKHGGITKDKRAPDQIGGYSFRGIDDADNVLCELTAKHGLMAFPRVLQQRCETQDIKGKLQRHVQCELEVIWAHVAEPDRTFRTVTWGEGIDSGDKGTGKAFSNARKQAMFSVFMIPTHGENIEEHATEIGRAPTEPAPEKPRPSIKKAQIAAEKESFNGSITDSIYGVKSFPVLQTFFATHGEDPTLVKAIINQAATLFKQAKTMTDVKEGLALYKEMGEPEDLTVPGNDAYARVRA